MAGGKKSMTGSRIQHTRGALTTETARRKLAGSLAALACMAVLTLAMLPLRPHLSIATTALVLVVPVVVGVTTGGFFAGALGTVCGFLVYDFFFIPPYLTLDVGASENWTALGIYVVVMLPVARVVAGMNAARAAARQRGLLVRRLFDLSTQLVQDRPLPELLHVIVNALADVLDAGHVALLLPVGDDLRVAATAGRTSTRPNSGDFIPNSDRSPTSTCLPRRPARDAGASRCNWHSWPPGAPSACWRSPASRSPISSANRCCCSPTRSLSPSSAPSCGKRRCARN
ncbi:DUF4118 domain-containing protein [Streptomyces sp. T1317-0309]|nr:DUF4118 domain-containing protein [Streptomyces sp. T1317-0309]